ncbi:MAG TPA: polyhydroxyalkanoic acid system family protein [Casimicrobiaceae bacterium]|jgi:putative polyhydroxyalkanoate system protein
MASISISKRHSLTHRKARDAAERVAQDLEERFDLAWSWEGDEVVFERTGLSGRMHVGAKEIRLDVKLGLLLSALKPAIEREIHVQLESLTVTREG